MLLFYPSKRHWLANNLFETQYGMTSNYSHFPQKWLLAQPESSKILSFVLIWSGIEMWGKKRVTKQQQARSRRKVCSLN